MSTSHAYESDRILLRPYERSDAARVLDIQSRMEVIRWISDPPHVPMRTLDEAVGWIERWADSRAEDPRMNGWAIEIRDTGVVAGTVLIVPLPNSDGLWQIGWHLHPDSTGQGYVTEAARGLLDMTFAAGMPELYAVMFPDNEPSARVARRLGMTEHGLVQTWYEGDSLCFSMTRSQHDALPR